ncbi:hypothetical protein JCM5350_003794 [Sporobolomyces pararoseus]
MLLGIGVDLLQLPRLRALLSRRPPHQLASRILSQPELDQFQTDALARDPTKVEKYLALRWTAKEAAYKALYPHYRMTWKDLVVSKRDKKPQLDFSQPFLSQNRNLDDIKMHLSISHDGDMMVAYVVAEKDRERERNLG